MGQGRGVKPVASKAPACALCSVPLAGRLPVCKACRKLLDAWRNSKGLGKYREGACMACNDPAGQGSATCEKKGSACRQRLSRLRRDIKQMALA